MSNPFEAAITCLQYWQGELSVTEDPDDYSAAIRVLEEFPKWERLIEAAGKVDERDLGRVFMGFVSTEMRALLEAIKSARTALPDPEERKG